MPDRVSLADLVLLLHFAFVLFVVGALLAIWMGVRLHWGIARQRVFRLAHLSAVWFVAIETLLGFACPLTLLEDALRTNNNAEGGGFLQRWVSRILYWDLPPWVFAVAYLLFAIVVTATYLKYPPRPPTIS